ncbi:MAG: FecR domain-containing protein [Prolixibacteraceae bacterium]
MDEKTSVKKVIELLYQKRSLDKQELSDIRDFLRNPGNSNELNAYLDEIPESSSSDIKLKVETIWQEIEKRGATASPFRQTLLIIQKYAAILVLPLLVYASWVSYQHFFAPEDYFTLSTNKGEQTNITLPDGSSAWLNVDTRITYNASYGKKNRKLTVNGEAFFNVKKNAAKPFIVQIRNMEVRALGTAFNVRGYDDEATVQTSLFDGKVDVGINHTEGHTERQILTPGQSLVFSKETDNISKKNFDQEVVGAWIDKQLVFDNTPFHEVIKNTERWFNVDIIYPVKQFESDFLTLRLKKGESLERLFEIIDETIGINYKKGDDKITLTKKE